MPHLSAGTLTRVKRRSSDFVDENKPDFVYRIMSGWDGLASSPQILALAGNKAYRVVIKEW